MLGGNINKARSETQKSKAKYLDVDATVKITQQSYEALISEYSMSRLSPNAMFHRCNNISKIIKKNHINDNSNTNDKNSINNSNNFNPCWKRILIEAGLIEYDSFFGSIEKYANKLSKNLDIDKYAIRAKRILDSVRKDKSPKNTIENIVFYQIEPYIEWAYKCRVKQCDEDKKHISETQKHNQDTTRGQIISNYGKVV